MKRWILLATLIALAAAAHGGEVVIKVNTHNSALERWTAEDFARAEPLPLPRIESPAALVRTEPPPGLGIEVVGDEAAEPTLSDPQRAAFRRILFVYSPAEVSGGELAAVAEAAPGPELLLKNRGTAEFDYTSSRLIPTEAAETFPYSAVGRLFLSPGGSFRNFCSAAVIGRRLVLTAGHCVYGGPDWGFHDDFVFVPAYTNAQAPYGSWEYSAVFVSQGYVDSQELPHPSDWALLEMQDQDGHRLSEVTGKLGFVVNNMAPNHLTMLGYPVGYDQAQEMHQVTSSAYYCCWDNTAIYGNDMGGGSSGGPWVQNFNRKSTGQGGGRNRARAAVVGVTSYGFSDESLRVLGASILNRDFKVLRQEACRNQDGNC